MEESLVWAPNIMGHFRRKIWNLSKYKSQPLFSNFDSAQLLAQASIWFHSLHIVKLVTSSFQSFKNHALRPLELKISLVQKWSLETYVSSQVRIGNSQIWLLITKFTRVFLLIMFSNFPKAFSIIKHMIWLSFSAK